MNFEHGIRTDPEFKKILDYVRAKYIMEGKKPPSYKQLTRVIANKTNKEELLRLLKMK